MSTTDPKPRRKQKHKEPKSQPVPNGTERLKTVVRRLPPNLPEEIFWQSVQAWVSEDTVTWKSYHAGKLRTKRSNKEGIPSRAYIAFKNEAQVASFSRAYDGHLFRDKAGNESYAVVEYAPFQRVPTEKKKIDVRNNTIDKDEDYLSFLETLKGTTKTESVSLEALIAASQPPPPPTTTPLLEALKAEKSAHKDKEAILRNHAHYKDAIAGSSKKEDARKKAAAAASIAAQQVAKPDSPVSTSKKAKKAAAAAAAAAQKAALTQAQEGQGPAMAKSAGTGAKPPTPARHRPPKEPHGRSHPSKGETPSASGPAPASASASVAVPVPTFGSVSAPSSSPVPPPAVPTENAPVPAPGQGQGQRKNRPVVGLGRHFEAALNGAGVGVSPGDRKRRDKGGEAAARTAPGTGTEGSSGAGKAGKQKHPHREERAHSPPPGVVPSILQRPTEVEVVIMQRPQSREGHGEGGASPGASVSPGPGASSGGGTPGAGPGGGRGSARRGRGRGRGHRGG